MSKSEEKTVKVTFSLSLESKETLSYLKKKGTSATSLLDTLLKFDKESADKFLTTYQQMNPDKIDNFNYLRLPTGGLVYKDSVMQKVIDSNISLVSDSQAIEKGVKAIKEAYEKKIDETDGKAILERVNIAEKAILSVHQRFLEQQSLVAALQKEVELLKG